MTSIRSFKAAITTRVDPLDATRLFSESRQLGNPATCPASAMEPDVDEFSRPLGGARFRLIKLDDPSCSSFVYPVSRRLKHENAERPILGPCNPGDRGAGDFMYGSVRDRYPQNVYGDGGMRGKFASYKKPKEDGQPVYNTSYTASSTRPLSLSHDSLVKPYTG